SRGVRSVTAAVLTLASASVIGLSGCSAISSPQGSCSPCEVSVANSPRSQPPPKEAVWFFHDSQGIVGQGDIWTKPPAPRSAVFDGKTGTYTLKMAWYRAAAGTLAISGNLLDGPGHIRSV